MLKIDEFGKVAAVSAGWKPTAGGLGIVLAG
jgi:hypothetical protein